MAEAAALFMNATAAAQLALLPTFSNKKNEDKFTAAQWLQKIINHRDGTDWTDQVFITHVRNSLRGDLIDWFDSLKPLGVDITIWANIQAAFETDYEAAPTASSIVNKIPTIKQNDQESVVQYFSRAVKIMEEFKTKIDPTRFVTPALVLVDGQPGFAGQEDFNALPAAFKTALDLHIRRHTTEQTLNNVGVILMTAGLKPELKSEILKRDNLVTLTDIKTVALKAERLNKEKNHKSSTNNGAVSDINQIHPNSNRGNNRGRGNGNYRGGHNNSAPQTQTYQSQRGSNPNGRGRGQPSRGQPSRGGYQNTSETTSASSSTQSREMKCTFCEMTNHPTEKCFKMQNASKTFLNNKKPKDKKVAQVSPEQEEYYEEHESNEQEDEPLNAVFPQHSHSKNY